MGTSFFIGIALLAAVQPAATLLYAQASATLQSRVFDASGSAIPRATTTRLATGKRGPSRQIQLAVKASF